MQKYGRTVTGVQRWWCFVCQKSGIRKRLDRTRFHRRILFLAWLTGTQSLTEIAKSHRTTRRTLESWFSPFWNEPPPVPPSVSLLTLDVLIIDAIYLGGRFNAALIGRTPEGVAHWSFALRESFISWLEFGQDLPTPFAVVLDGQRGGLAAVRALWPKAKIQRCMAHVTRYAKNKLTRNPKTEAGQVLRVLTSALFNVHSTNEQATWLEDWQSWEERFVSLVLAKTRGVNQNGRQTWWFTHKNLRGAYIHLKNAIPTLFTYISYPNIPRTTNHIEGGINSRLKELLGRHRGISLKQKQTLVAIFLDSKRVT